MAADVFGRNITYAGRFLPENVRVSFSGISANVLISDITIEYAEPVNRIWDLNGGRCFLVPGQPNGSWGIGSIGGGGSLNAVKNFTVCNPGTISFSGSSGLCTKLSRSNFSDESGSYTLENAITTMVRVAASSGNMVINEGVGGIFLSLSVSGTSSRK